MRWLKENDMSGFLTNLIGTFRKRARIRPAAKRPRPAGLALESLEDRMTPSSGRLFLGTSVGVYVTVDPSSFDAGNFGLANLGADDATRSASGGVVVQGGDGNDSAPINPSLPDPEFKYVPVRRTAIFSAVESGAGRNLLVGGTGVDAADDGSGVNGHGTHVAGTVASQRTSLQNGSLKLTGSNRAADAGSPTGFNLSAFA